MHEGMSLSRTQLKYKKTYTAGEGKSIDEIGLYSTILPSSYFAPLTPAVHARCTMRGNTLYFTLCSQCSAS